MLRSRPWLFLLAWVGAAGATSNLPADILVAESVTNSGSSAEHEVDLTFPGDVTEDFISFVHTPFPGGAGLLNLGYSTETDSTTMSFLDAPGGSGIAPSASGTFGYDYSGSSDSPDSQVGLVSNSADLANPASIQLPALTLGINAPSGGSGTQYIIEFVNVTSGGQTVGNWFEVPYTGATLPQFVPQNYTGSPETLSNVGFLLSPTLIPLDQLNSNDLPPSSFTPVPSYNPNIGASSDEIINLPEPSGVVLLALGALALISCGICRRGPRAG